MSETRNADEAHVPSKLALRLRGATISATPLRAK